MIPMKRIALPGSVFLRAGPFCHCAPARQGHQLCDQNAHGCLRSAGIGFCLGSHAQCGCHDELSTFCAGTHFFHFRGHCGAAGRSVNHSGHRSKHDCSLFRSCGRSADGRALVALRRRQRCSHSPPKRGSGSRRNVRHCGTGTGIHQHAAAIDFLLVQQKGVARVRLQPPLAILGAYFLMTRVDRLWAFRL